MRGEAAMAKDGAGGVATNAGGVPGVEVAGDAGFGVACGTMGGHTFVVDRGGSVAG